MRLGDHRREVAVGDVGHARPADEARGEDPVLVGVLRPLEAVGRHQDRPGELGEFLLLVLPGRPVVAVQMRVLLQPRVAVGGEHLAVGVDVDPLPLGLLEQLFEVPEVVAGDEDRLPLLRPEGDRRGDRLAVGAGVGRVEDLHRPEVDLAAFHHQGQRLVEL